MLAQCLIPNRLAGKALGDEIHEQFHLHRAPVRHRVDREQFEGRNFVVVEHAGELAALQILAAHQGRQTGDAAAAQREITQQMDRIGADRGGQQQRGLLMGALERPTITGRVG